MFYEVGQSSGSGYDLQGRFKKRVMAGGFEPGMSVDLAYEDSRQALQLASELNVPPFVAQVTHGVFEWARAERLGSKDYGSLVTLWERMPGFGATKGSARME